MVLRSIVARFAVVITVLTSIIVVSRCFDTLTEVFLDFSQFKDVGHGPRPPNT
jgi:hypothetical protein